MRWFLDTEFNEDGRTIELISIALVSERGDSYYAVSKEFDPAKCSDWVRANVLLHLLSLEPGDWWKTCKEIATDLRHMLLADGEPEIWGYFSDYDWVALCQLFGTMMDLPDGFPMFCLDLKQEMHRRGIKREDLPAQTGTHHDALEDARWIRDAWLQLRAEAVRKAGE